MSAADGIVVSLDFTSTPSNATQSHYLILRDRQRSVNAEYWAQVLGVAFHLRSEKRSDSVAVGQFEGKFRGVLEAFLRPDDAGASPPPRCAPLRPMQDWKQRSTRYGILYYIVRIEYAAATLRT
jgi:hypothetical protein